MKKTLTVNLNNIVFHIDDDAYEMLQTYLSEISDHFKQEDERSEIMNDIEARIAELFTEKLQKNKNVINLTDVQEIIVYKLLKDLFEMTRLNKVFEIQ